MNKIVAIVVALFFIQAASAQNFEPKTKMDHVLFAISAIERDSDFVAALDYINEAISEDSTNAFCYTVRGNIYLLQKSYSLALEDFHRVIALNPDDFSSFLARAKCWYFLKDYGAALKDLNQAAHLEPFDGDVYFWRSKVRKILGDNAGSEADFKIYKNMNAD